MIKLVLSSVMSSLVTFAVSSTILFPLVKELNATFSGTQDKVEQVEAIPQPLLEESVPVIQTSTSEVNNMVSEVSEATVDNPSVDINNPKKTKLLKD